MTSLRKNKKAEGSVKLLIEVFGMVIAGLLVLALIFFINKVNAAFFSNEPDQGTEDYFKALAQAMGTAKEGKEPFPLPYYLGEGFKVVAFDKEGNTLLDRCLKDTYESKPQKCSSSACLVLCGDSEGGCRNDLKSFYTFKDVDKIVAKNVESNYGDDTHLLLYGDCTDSDDLIGKKVSYGTKKLYVGREGNTLIISSEK